MTDELRIKATKILMKSDLTVDEIADIHEAMCQDGAIEFLRKAKAICENEGDCSTCPMGVLCITDINILNDETDLVRKVMDYQIKEASHD